MKTWIPSDIPHLSEENTNKEIEESNRKGQGDRFHIPGKWYQGTRERKGKGRGNEMNKDMLCTEETW